MARLVLVVVVVICAVAMVAACMTDLTDPGTLRTVEYLANNEAALEDREAMRTHAETMARIEAERDVELAFYASLRTGVVWGILAVVLLASVAVVAAAMRSAQGTRLLVVQQEQALLDGEVEGRYRVIDDEAFGRLGSRVQIEQKGKRT